MFTVGKFAIPDLFNGNAYANDPRTNFLNWNMYGGGSYDWNGRGIDDIEPVPDQATNLPGQPPYYEAIDIREYRYYRSRWGLAGSADYKLAEGSNIYLHGLYSDFKNFGDRWVYSLNDNTTGLQLLGSNGCSTDSTGTTVAPCSGVPSFNTQIRRPDYAIGSLILGGKHVFSSTWFAWDISAGRSRQIVNGDPSASFDSTLDTSACQYDPAATKSIYRPQFSAACFTEAYNPDNFVLNKIESNHGLTAQVNLQVTGAFAKRYHIGSHTSTVEVGGGFRNAHKFDNSVGLEFDANTTVPLSQFPSRLKRITTTTTSPTNWDPIPRSTTFSLIILRTKQISTPSRRISPASTTLLRRFPPAT